MQKIAGGQENKMSGIKKQHCDLIAKVFTEIFRREVKFVLDDDDPEYQVLMPEDKEFAFVISWCEAINGDYSLEDIIFNYDNDNECPYVEVDVIFQSHSFYEVITQTVAHCAKFLSEKIIEDDGYQYAEDLVSL